MEEKIFRGGIKREDIAGTPQNYSSRADDWLCVEELNSSNMEESFEIFYQLKKDGRYATTTELEKVKNLELMTQYTNFLPVDDALVPDYDSDHLSDEMNFIRNFKLSGYNYYQFAPGIMDFITGLVRCTGFKKGNITTHGFGCQLAESLNKKFGEKATLDMDFLFKESAEVMSMLRPEDAMKTYYYKDFLPIEKNDIAIVNIPFSLTSDAKSNGIRNETYISEIHHNMPTQSGIIQRTLHTLRTNGIAFLVMPSTYRPAVLVKNPMDIGKYIKLDAGYELEKLNLGNDVEILGAYECGERAGLYNQKNSHGQPLEEKIRMDILVIRKKEKKRLKNWDDNGYYSTSEIKSPEGDEYRNTYFNTNPTHVNVAGLFDFLSDSPGTLTSDPSFLFYCERYFHDCSFKGSYVEAPIDENNITITTRPYDEAAGEIKNFTFTKVEENGESIYLYRDDDVLREILVKSEDQSRMDALIGLKAIIKNLFRRQEEECDDKELDKLLKNLNMAYDEFVKDFGLIDTSANTKIMKEDMDFPLLLSLEQKKESGGIEKTAIFYRRIIDVPEPVIYCQTLEEAYYMSMTQYGEINLEFMSRILSMTEEDVITKGIGIYFYVNPETGNLLDAETYLSGNISKKIEAAESCNFDGRYDVNIENLKKVIPDIIPADDISINIANNWIPDDIMKSFIVEYIIDDVNYTDEDIEIYKTATGLYRISVKRSKDLAQLNYVYGVDKSYTFCDILSSLKNHAALNYYVRVGTKRIKDESKTVDLQEKADAIKQAFETWLDLNPLVREELARYYNETYNVFVKAKYSGEHLTFPNMSSAIELAKHQKDAVYRGIREGGCLYTHCTGAGKTYTILALAYELKRLGFVNKLVIVVPNKLINQWASEGVKLYPTANIFLGYPDDFHKGRKEITLKRMTVSNPDFIIMGMSAYKLIVPNYKHARLTSEKEMEVLWERRYNGKVMSEDKKAELLSEATNTKHDKWLYQIFNDTILNPEYEMSKIGIDYMAIDECQNYKGLDIRPEGSLPKGISVSLSNRAQDLYYKKKYFDSLYQNRQGSSLGTATPVANSLADMYVWQRFFQEELLFSMGIYTIQDWLSMFGEETNDWELPPEGLSKNGQGFRRVTRISAFVNLPELLKLLFQFMDVCTAEQLDFEDDLPVATYETIVSQISPTQQKYQDFLVARATSLRKGFIPQVGFFDEFEDDFGSRPKNDCYLLVTTDGKKAALDIRMIDPTIPELSYGKINKCANKVVDIYEDYRKQKGTQLVFCDYSTPSKGKPFTVYDALKKALIEKGVLEQHIAFVQDFKTPKQEAEMRHRMLTGELRVLIGSSSTLGTGQNVQRRLIAIHHLDAPWRPLEIEQREGRIVRVGNIFEKVMIFTYVTENTFDAYVWQTLQQKAQITAMILRNDYQQRTVENVDNFVMNLAQIKAASTGNTLFMDMATLENKVRQLESLERSHQIAQSAIRRSVNLVLPNEIADLEKQLPTMELDNTATMSYAGIEEVEVDNEIYDLFVQTDKEQASLKLYQKFIGAAPYDIIGKYNGFNIVVVSKKAYSFYSQRGIYLENEHIHSQKNIETLKSGPGILRVAKSLFDNIPQSFVSRQQLLETKTTALETSKKQLSITFTRKDELENTRQKLEDINLEIAELSKKDLSASA